MLYFIFMKAQFYMVFCPPISDLLPYCFLNTQSLFLSLPLAQHALPFESPMAQ